MKRTGLAWLLILSLVTNGIGWAADLGPDAFDDAIAPSGTADEPPAPNDLDRSQSSPSPASDKAPCTHGCQVFPLALDSQQGGFRVLLLLRQPPFTGPMETPSSNIPSIHPKPPRFLPFA